MVTWGLSLDLSPWNNNKLNSYNSTHLRYRSIQRWKNSWETGRRSWVQNKRVVLCSWTPWKKRLREHFIAGSWPLEALSSAAWVISLFHAAEPKEQGREQGRDQVKRGKSCGLATAITKCEPESWNLVMPFLTNPECTTPVSSQS